MTFKPTSVTGPGGEPNVRIYFHGLLLLRSEDGNVCEAGVHHAAFRHTLSVEARTRTPNRPDVIHMRHFGPLKFREEGQPGMSIEIDGSGRPAPAAFKFVTPAALNFETGEVPPETPEVAEDFRWIINLEGGLFHGDELDCTVFGTQHVIRLGGGEYYFYTARRADSGLKFVRKEGGKGPKDFRRIGSIIGARVFLSGDQSITLTWNDGMQEEDQTLRLSKPQTGSIHEIYVENSPLYEPPSNSGTPPRHSELPEYYKVIRGKIGNARFRLDPVKENGPQADGQAAPPPSGSAKFDSERGSPSIPCQSIVLDGPVS